MLTRDKNSCQQENESQLIDTEAADTAIYIFPKIRIRIPD